MHVRSSVHSFAHIFCAHFYFAETGEEALIMMISRDNIDDDVDNNNIDVASEDDDYDDDDNNDYMAMMNIEWRRQYWSMRLIACMQ